MTWEQAFIHAFESTKITGRRYRVFKSRGVIGWWQTIQLAD